MVVISSRDSVSKGTEKSKHISPGYSKKYMESGEIRLEGDYEDLNKSSQRVQTGFL